MTNQTFATPVNALQQAAYQALVDVRTIARKSAGLSNVGQSKALREIEALADSFHNAPLSPCTPRELRRVLEKAAMHGLDPGQYNCLSLVVALVGQAGEP
jgi:hypothetical protein